MKKALVVDDDPIIRNLIGALLRRRGVAAAQAANGDEAMLLLRASLDHAHRSEYDLVVLDLMMPKVSGWDVIRFIVDELPKLKPHVLVVSATGEAALEEIRAHGLGAIVSKPFDADFFYDAVDRTVRRRPDTEGDSIALATLCLAAIAPLF
ncbi:MAG: response regulator [Thermoanaerobaculia bacterium]